jgi:DNA replication protein DnaC
MTFTFENFKVTAENKEAYEAFKNYKAENIYLIGGCGRGKSYLAQCLAGNFDTIIRTTPAEINRKMRDTDAQTEIKIIDKLSTISILVIDELGIRKETDYTRSIITEVMDKRYYSDLGMIAISNLGLEDLAELYQDDRIPSRLSAFKLILIKGKDWRCGK